MTTITKPTEKPVFYAKTSDKQSNVQHVRATTAHEIVLDKEQTLQKARATSGAKVQTK
jgi:hypothetical protein